MNNQEFIPTRNLNFKIFVDAPAFDFKVLGLSGNKIKISSVASGHLCKSLELNICKDGKWESYHLKILENVEPSSIFLFQLENAHKKDFLKDLFSESAYNRSGGIL